MPTKAEQIEALKQAMAHIGASISPSDLASSQDKVLHRAAHEASSECENTENGFPGECDNPAFSLANNDALLEEESSRAFNQILRWVSARERSSLSVRTRLRELDYSEAAIDAALERAQKCSAINDKRYAGALIRTKQAQGKGMRAVQWELEQLGVDLDSLDEWNDYMNAGRDAELERALELLRRKPPRAKLAREAAYRKLVTQGYSTSIASDAARRWYKEYCAQQNELNEEE